MSFQIVIAQPVHAPVLEQLQAHGRIVANPGPEPWQTAELAERCQRADALMVFMTETVDEAFLQRCPNLKIVAGALKGYNNIDVEACTRRSIAVTIVPDLLTEPTAELAIGLMISIARNVGPGDRYVKSGEFNGWRPRFYGGSINGATVTVIGAGAVGQAILRMLAGFDCQRLYVDKRPLTAELEENLKCRRSNLTEALAVSDFIVLGVHLMASTRHMVDRQFIEQMKPGSYLVNPARGSLVDESAVVQSLANGRLAGYAADTFEMEDWALADRPRAVDAGLIASDRTVLTPHIGSAVTAVRQAIEHSAAESIISMANGDIPESAVNKTALLAR
jgi:phosphonate dehydrogenase